LYHLPVDWKKAKSYVDGQQHVIHATSYGEAHTLIVRRDRLLSTHYELHDDSEMVKHEGYWFRLSIGLQPAEEIEYALLSGFARHFSEPVGEVDHVFKKLGVIGIRVASEEMTSRLRAGDVLVAVPQSGEPFRFFDVLEDSQFHRASAPGEGPSLTVRVSGRPRRRMLMHRILRVEELAATLGNEETDESQRDLAD
jgi:cystathionine gamma-lyase